MKKYLFAFLALFSLSAFAAPPQVTGTLELLNVPAYRGTAEFAVTVEGKQHPNSIVFLNIECYTGGSNIYHISAVAPSDWVMPLDFDQWKDWETTCNASLIYREYSNRYFYGRLDRYLAVVSFDL